MRNEYIKVPVAGVCSSKALRVIFALALLLSIGVKSNAQVFHAEAKLQQYTIKIGEQTKLFFVVHQPKTEQVIFPILKDTINAKVLISKPKADTIIDPQDNKQIIVTKTYMLTCFDAGKYTIPSYRFVVSGGDLTTNELTLEVNTVKVDTTKAIYDIKQPLHARYNFWDWLLDHPWVIVLLWFVIGGIVGLMWWLKHRPKKEEVVAPTPKVIIPMHVQMLNKLQEIRDRKLWQNHMVKEYYVEITDVLREYIEQRYGIKTHEKTTDEIFDGLRYADLENENRNTLRQVLMLADLVKFAKEQPSPAENEMSMDNAVNFVKRTALVTVLPTTDEGGDNGPA